MSPRKKKEFREHELSRRERQIMAAVYRAAGATVAEIVAAIPEPPTPDAVRRMCHILVDKELLRAEPDGPRNRFHPTVDAKQASRSALDNLMDTFFGGSPHRLVAALLDSKRGELSDDDGARLTEMIATMEDEERGR